MIGHNARDGNKNRWADGTGREETEMGREIARSGSENPHGGDARGDTSAGLFLFFSSVILFYVILSCAVCTSPLDRSFRFDSERP